MQIISVIISRLTFFSSTGHMATYVKSLLSPVTIDYWCEDFGDRDAGRSDGNHGG
jgi:hypothetical protein